MDAIRIGKTEESGYPLIVVELFVSMLAENLHQERRVTGWLMATRLSPVPPSLPEAQ